MRDLSKTPLPEAAGQSVPMALHVRLDSFDVSSVTPPIRVIMGMEYYFKADGTSIETSRDPSRYSAMNWIVVTGSQRGREIKLAITHGNEGQLHDAWKALIAAGATPIGSPPGGARPIADGYPPHGE